MPELPDSGGNDNCGAKPFSYACGLDAGGEELEGFAVFFVVDVVGSDFVPEG